MDMGTKEVQNIKEYSATELYKFLHKLLHLSSPNILTDSSKLQNISQFHSKIV